MRLRRPAAAAAPRVDRDAHAGLDRPRRRIAGRVPLVPAELLGALRRYAPHIALGASGGRFLIRNSTGSIFDQVGELVHHDFGDERALRVARAPASGAAGRC